jgi:membrane protease YdiL (CAAX protease family)
VGFGYAVVYFVSRRSLWGSILTHGLYDTAAFVIFFLGRNNTYIAELKT